MLLNKEEKESVRAFRNQANSLLPEGWEMVEDTKFTGLVLMHENDAIMPVNAPEILATLNSSLAKVVKAAYAKKVVETNPEPIFQGHKIAQVDAMIKEVEGAVKKTLVKCMETNRWIGLSTKITTFDYSYQEDTAEYSVSLGVEISTKE